MSERITTEQVKMLRELLEARGEKPTVKGFARYLVSGPDFDWSHADALWALLTDWHRLRTIILEEGWEGEHGYECVFTDAWKNETAAIRAEKPALDLRGKLGKP